MSQQAALYLKLVVNQNWTLPDDKGQITDSQKPFDVANKENVGNYNA